MSSENDTDGNKTPLTLWFFAFKVNEEGEHEQKGEEEEEEKISTMPRKAGNPILNKK